MIEQHMVPGAEMQQPIFVHASPRSGSTYFFNVLRRSDFLMCFNEPLSDVFGYWGKKGTAEFKENLKWEANHEFLERDDFAEIIEAWDFVMPLHPDCLPYRDYLPPDGRLSSELRAYLAAFIDYARSRSKRPALCEIHSRGRAGALRDAFGGIHIAQYRDPLSQFGSYFRPLQKAGEWYFLVFPLMELGLSGNHPLYSLVPETWRVPVLPWPVDDPAQRWASTLEYLGMVASPRSETIEKLFRWHLFAWLLSNLAAICHSDIILDVDRAYDDNEYRRSISEALASKIGFMPDFSDLTKFSRYHRFEGLDVAKVCDEVKSTIMIDLRDGRVDGALRKLGSQMTRSPAAGIELLLAKIHRSLAQLKASANCTFVSAEEWHMIADRHQRIWFNPYFRRVGQQFYRIGAPILRVARRAGVLS